MSFTDGYGVVRVGVKTIPFFREWERRAMNSSTLAARQVPYLRYYSSNQPLDDHEHRPLVLVVFDDFIWEGNFLGVARDEMKRAGVDVPLWVSSGSGWSMWGRWARLGAARTRWTVPPFPMNG